MGSLFTVCATVNGNSSCGWPRWCQIIGAERSRCRKNRKGLLLLFFQASADPSPPSCPVRPTPSGFGGGRAPLVNSPDAHQHELTKVKPTDVIAEEMPFAHAVKSRLLKKVCSNCLVMKSDDTEVILKLDYLPKLTLEPEIERMC